MPIKTIFFTMKIQIYSKQTDIIFIILVVRVISTGHCLLNSPMKTKYIILSFLQIYAMKVHPVLQIFAFTYRQILLAVHLHSETISPFLHYGGSLFLFHCYFFLHPKEKPRKVSHLFHHLPLKKWEVSLTSHFLKNPFISIFIMFQENA